MAGINCEDFGLVANKCMKCKDDILTEEHGDDVFRGVSMRYFYAQCPKTNLLCSSISGAWVPAVTVCSQQLW